MIASRISKKESEQLLAEAVRGFEERLRVLKEEHHQQAMMLESKWNDPSVLARFAKPSPALLAARRQEHVLALAERYDAAATQREICSVMEEQESEDAQARVRVAAQAEIGHLARKQRAELQALMDRADRERQAIVVSREAGLEPLLARKAMIASQLALMRGRPGDARNRGLRSAMSPRTMRRLTEFRAGQAHAKLIVHPLGKFVRFARP